MELAAKDEKALTTLIGVGTGIAAWEAASTQQYVQFNPTGYGLFSKQRFGDAVASTFGQGIAKQVMPGYTGAANQGFSPLKVVNKYSVGGGAVLVASELADNLDHYDKFKPFVDAIGWGLLVGGAIGGFFDPEGYVLPGNAPATSPRGTVGSSYGVAISSMNARVA